MDGNPNGQRLDTFDILKIFVLLKELEIIKSPDSSRIFLWVLGFGNYQTAKPMQLPMSVCVSPVKQTFTEKARARVMAMGRNSREIL